jgi:hypothetical protein
MAQPAASAQAQAPVQVQSSAAKPVQTSQVYSESKKGLLEILQDFFLIFFDKAVLFTLPEVAHLAPLIFTFATAFWALLTFNKSLGVFALSSAEAWGVSGILKTMFDYSITPFLGEQGPTNDSCKSQFSSLTPSRFAFIMREGLKSQIPNTNLYMLSFAASYIIQSMKHFNKEMATFGEKFSNRPYLALITAAIILFIYSIYLYIYGCSSVPILLISILTGIAAGILISYQNVSLFGKDAVNVMFTPYFIRKTGMDYVCVTPNA